MALEIFEKQLKEETYSMETDMGTYRNNCFNIMKDMMPTEYKGEIKVPDIFKSKGGIWELQKTVDMFSLGRLDVGPSGNGGCYLTCRLQIVNTVVPYDLYSVTVAVSDTVEEMAVYLRRYWGIPLYQRYAAIPDTVEKLNTWLHDYGANDIKVYKNGNIFEYEYRIDTHYPSHVAKEPYHDYACVGSVKELALLLMHERYQLMRIWSPEEEMNVIYKTNVANEIEYGWTGNKRNVFGKRASLICRTLGRCKDGSYILQDMSYQIKRLSKEVIKEAIKTKQLEVIDLQVSKDNRLIKKHVNLKKVCRPYGCGADGKEPLSFLEQRQILFCGLAFINSNLTVESKKKICSEIKGTGSIDADDLISMFTENNKWDEDRYIGLDTACRDKVIELIYMLSNK